MSGPGLEDPSTFRPPVHLPSVHPPVIHTSIIHLPACRLPIRPSTPCLLSTQELPLFWAMNRTDPSPRPPEAYETEATARSADSTGVRTPPRRRAGSPGRASRGRRHPEGRGGGPGSTAALQGGALCGVTQAALPQPPRLTTACEAPDRRATVAQPRRALRWQGRAPVLWTVGRGHLPQAHTANAALTLGHPRSTWGPARPGSNSEAMALACGRLPAHDLSPQGPPHGELSAPRQVTEAPRGSTQ